MKLQNKDSVMNLGDTSFRRKNLLDDYKIMLQGITEQLEEWNTNNSSQMTFYQYVAKSGLIDDTFYGDYYSFISDKFKESIFEKYKDKRYENNKTVKDYKSLLEYFISEQKKRGRTYTNALVKIGLVDEKRKITAVGEALLDGDTKQDNIEKLFNLSADNIIFLRQLLKLRVYESEGKNYIYPFRMGIYLLSKFDDIPQKEFCTILSLIRAGKKEEEYREILDKYKFVKNKNMSFGEYVSGYIQEETSEIEFEEKYRISKEKFEKYFLNRKSKDKIEDYFEFYEISLDFFENRNFETYKRLEKISKKGSIKKAFGYNKVPFKFCKTLKKFFEENKETIFEAENTEEFNKLFYELFRDSKNYDLIFEYNDMTIRTFNLSGLISFENGLVNLSYKWLSKNIFSEIIGMKKLSNEVVKDNFHKNVSFSEIFDLSEERIESFIEKLRKENNIPKEISIFEHFSDKIDKDFEKKLEKRFSNDKVCSILNLFKNRENDEKISKEVTDNAKIPTIFEYILAIAWHRISNKEFNLKKSLKLSLDGDGFPLSHAPGGDGDIIAEYSEFDVMLEATLMDRNTQKRGELEPVIRHTTNLTIKNMEENKKTYTFFVANELDMNVINIFRATSQIRLQSTQDREKYTNGIKIYSLTIDKIVYLLENNINYKYFLNRVFENYSKIEFIGNNWCEDTWNSSVKGEKFKIYNRRYLGSKYKLLEFIEKIVQENTKNCKIFLDLFAGTGVVADYFNKKYDVVLNDLLRCNYFSYECFFSNLEYEEKKLIEIMKKYNEKVVEDNNYYSENFKDTYLSEKNLKKVGFIRDDIDDLFEKKEINKREKAILITSLIYAVDRIANTVGHYDAYRKNGDLEKELILKIPQIENDNNKNNKIFCMDANELVKKFKADIVYIDPPYNSRQYSDAYHFLENMATNKKPKVFGIAKKMDRTHIKSKYCLSSAKQTLEELIKNIEAKYILFSYNNTQQKANSRSNARISDNEILEILKSKGEVTVFEKDFSPFTVGKTNIKNHTERVFFCRVRKDGKNKKNSKENIINNITEKNTVAEENQLFILENIKKKMVQSPLNYTGGKFRLLKQIFEKIPENIDVFYDIFCGGFNVGVNFNAKKIIGIDKNKELIKLLKFLKKQNYENLEKEIEEKIEYYGLSNSFKNGYEYYGCNSYDGLGKYNKEKFLRLRKE